MPLIVRRSKVTCSGLPVRGCATVTRSGCGQGAPATARSAPRASGSLSAARIRSACSGQLIEGTVGCRARSTETGSCPEERRCPAPRCGPAPYIGDGRTRAVRSAIEVDAAVAKRLANLVQVVHGDRRGVRRRSASKRSMHRAAGGRRLPDRRPAARLLWVRRPANSIRRCRADPPAQRRGRPARAATFAGCRMPPW
jgi:hypothetical protein